MSDLDFILTELKRYSPRDFLMRGYFLISFIIGIFVFFIGSYSTENCLRAIAMLIPISIQASITLTAITTAGLVFIISAQKNDTFVTFLVENKLYDGMLFLFIEPVLVGMINITFAVLILILSTLFAITGLFAALILGLVVALFLYTIFGFVGLYFAFRMYGTERRV